MAEFKQSDAKIKRVCIGVGALCVSETGYECATLRRGYGDNGRVSCDAIDDDDEGYCGDRC